MASRTLGLLAIPLALLLDQLSKWIMLDLLLNPPREIILLSFFKLTPVWNRGVSFGLFPADSIFEKYMLVIIALLICIYLAFWLCREKDKWSGFALGMIIGGATGNVIDRLRFGAVKDFLYFHFENWAWPAFNLADSFIVTGVALLILRSMLLPNPEKATKSPHKV